MNARVLVIQRLLTHYRRPFFEGLRAACAGRGVTLDLVYGGAQGADALRQDTVELPWATRVENKSLSLGPLHLCWQPCLRALPGHDLVIVEQANKLLLNHLLVLGQGLGAPRLCFWGHGKNLQARGRKRLAEAVKRLYSRRAHWWFAYTGLSAEIIAENGFPAGRITDVQNSIDTGELTRARQAVTPDELAQLRGALGLAGQNVCLFIGGMYPDKRLDYLVRAGEAIRRRVPDFELVCIGAGRQEGVIREAAARLPWLKHVPPVFGAAKTPYFLLAKLVLMPGLVGLALLDAFALGTPLVTEAHDFHSPEIRYLEDGVNGVMVHSVGDAEAYAERVAALLRDEPARRRLAAGGEASASRYTLQNMIARFSQGIVDALEAV